MSLRQTIVDIPSEEGAHNYLDQDIVPTEARTSRERRRKADPLGEGTLVCGGCG